MQEIEDNKVLKKAIIIASSSQKEIESKLKKIKEENSELKKSVPEFSHLKLDMPLLLESVYKKLSELRQAAVINKNIKINLLTQVEELRQEYKEKDATLKAIKKKNQLEKKGSYSQLNMVKKFVNTPNHSKNSSFYFG
jgi:hypothetical protein